MEFLMKFGNSEQIGQRMEFPGENSQQVYAERPSELHSHVSAKTIFSLKLIIGGYP
jgi:hypothetical protein